MPESRSILVERIDQKLAERPDLTDRALSIRATGKPDLIRDIRRRGTAPAGDKLARLAEELGTTTEWLLGKTDNPAPVLSEVSIADRRMDWRGPAPTEPGIPLVGTGDCAEMAVVTEAGDHIQVERSSFDPEFHVRYIERPPALRGDKSIYAIYFHGSSMEPRFFAGEVGIVQPSRPAGPGDYVVVQLNDGTSDDVVTVLVKRLVRQSSREVVLEQHNPPATFALPRGKIARIHRIIPPTEQLL